MGTRALDPACIQHAGRLGHAHTHSILFLKHFTTLAEELQGPAWHPAAACVLMIGLLVGTLS